MKIAFFGSSLLSAYWNGAATYYRGILRALAMQGHQITFYEPDAYDRQQHCDIEPPEWASVVVYENTQAAVERQLESSRSSDLIIKASGVGVFDEWLEAAVPLCKSERTLVAFWDVDAPATLDRIWSGGDPFRDLIPKYDFIFTYGGGLPVIRSYRELGAALCVPIYNGLDTSTHFPTSSDPACYADLLFIGNRLPDREGRVKTYFFEPACKSPTQKFLLGGNGWGDYPFPPNISYSGHVYTSDHNKLNCSARMVLNISRSSMAATGFSPATRVFEAAGAGACLVTDYWEGIECFFEPGREILIAQNGEDVARLLASVSESEARRIGEAALQRALREHTYEQRARQFESAIEEVLKV